MASCTVSELPLTPPLSATDEEFKSPFLLTDLKVQLENVAAVKAPGPRYERKMGDTELSYFLPSRQSGVNDM